MVVREVLVLAWRRAVSVVRSPRLTPVLQRLPRIALLAALGPGLVSGFADNDAGGITTYSVVGARFGYDLMWVLLVSMVALAITQEVGARLGLATGKGLLDLIREEFGVRWAAVAIATMLLANLGDTIAEFAGIGAALELFGVAVPVSDSIAAIVAFLLLVRGSYGRTQLVFLALGAGVSLAYAVSALLARPDWHVAAVDLVVPHGHLGAAYVLAVVGTVGTTITPWGQAFIQSYVADKGLTPRHLTSSRIDIGLGALVTNAVAGLILVAAAATLYAHGQRTIADGAAAARALAPFAGRFAEVAFALGLLGASFLGLGTVPLTSAYATSESLGVERGLRHHWRDAPVFYGLLAFFIGAAATFVLIPGLPLIQVMFLSQVFDGALLPVILVFVMLLARRHELLGGLHNSRTLALLGWSVTVLTSILSIALVVTQIF